jgi:ankyrin repeat protein
MEECMEWSFYYYFLEFKHILDVKMFNRITSDFKKNVRRLLREVLNTQDHEGYTPLHVAAYSGDYLASEHFLKLGADPTLKV